RHKELEFSAKSASAGVASLALAVAGILMPSLYAHGENTTAFRIETVSVGVAIVLLVLYGASLVFAFVTHPEAAPPSEVAAPDLSMRAAVALLFVAGALVAFESEVLVGALEKTVAAANLSRIWVGLI